MSVIHEEIKRAGAAKPAARPALTVKTSRASSPWLWWLMSFFVLTEGALYLRERGLRLDAEEKMRQAYLQMNDARGEYLEKSVSESRASAELSALKIRYKDALRAKTEALNAKQGVEYENLASQKKVSDLTKKMHENEMDRLHLEDEVKKLKAELSSK